MPLSLTGVLTGLPERLVDPPLDPSADEARRLLRHELLNPAYYDRSFVQRLLTWLDREIGRGVDSAGRTPPLTWFAATLVALALMAGLVLLVSRARLTARERSDKRSVLTDEGVTAAELRARAERALADGRHEEAVVDSFRALAVRQVERGRLDDTPGATAHEVARALAAEYPHQRPRVDESATIFDAVKYGERPASRAQAMAVLELDDELRSVR